MKNSLLQTYRSWIQGHYEGLKDERDKNKEPIKDGLYLPMHLPKNETRGKKQGKACEMNFQWQGLVRATKVHAFATQLFCRRPNLLLKALCHKCIRL